MVIPEIQATITDQHHAQASVSNLVKEKLVWNLGDTHHHFLPNPKSRQLRPPRLHVPWMLLAWLRLILHALRMLPCNPSLIRPVG
jgi:hypothetical protein